MKQMPSATGSNCCRHYRQTMIDWRNLDSDEVAAESRRVAASSSSDAMTDSDMLDNLRHRLQCDDLRQELYIETCLHSRNDHRHHL